ncbi:MAG: glycosyltransferase family 4 protein [Candidatus Omnitrophica bacterium]|nr:glycosyltransferase family 4 protein [Candidatus Omnitrophota bacterium]
MKVLLLTTHINVGGIGIYTVNLAGYLQKAGADVTVVSGGGELESILSKEGVRHIKMDILTKSEFGIKVWKTLPAFARLVKDGDFDLVHAQTRVAQVLASLSRRLTGVPFITTCHGFFRFKRFGRRIFPLWGDRVIAISRNVKAHLIHDFTVPEEIVRLVYSGIEVERFTDRTSPGDAGLRRDLGLVPGGVTIGSVGRFSPVKGYSFLIKAFREVMAAFPDASLLLVGRGPEKEMLGRLAAGLGISDNVFFAEGRKAPLEEYLALMDVFCLPSLAEGLGLSLMEAMASGCACVASDVGGLSELIVSGEDGILVPPRAPERLAAAVTRLLKDPGLRRTFSGRCREKARRDFSIRDSAARTMAVYREVTASRRGRHAEGDMPQGDTPEV